MSGRDMSFRGVPSRHQAQAGFTMVEVLIAVLVLSIGLIGLASLQGVALQFNNSAYLRSQATNLAYDMADRVRANRAAALNGEYELAAADPAPAPGALPDTDLNEWRTALQNSLPAGTGGVNFDPATNRLAIVVCWDDTRGDATGVVSPAACGGGGVMGFVFTTGL